MRAACGRVTQRMRPPAAHADCLGCLDLPLVDHLDAGAEEFLA